MLIDRPNIVEGSSIQNATVASGATAPANAGVGELFYFTTTAATGKIGFHAFSGAAWNYVPTGTEFDSHLADGALHLTAAQNALLDGVVGTLTATEVNYLDGVTSPIQTQLNTIVGVNNTQDATLVSLQSQITNNAGSGTTALNTHAADLTLHLTAAQNTFLDAINLPTITGAHVNSIPTLTSDLSTLTTNFGIHASDLILHLTPQQNTFLDGVNYAAVGFADVNHLNGLDGFLGSGVALATYLSGLNTNKLSRDGTQSMTGNLGMGNNRITALADPVNTTDAATKNYVDQLQQGLHWKQAARVATTTNISLGGLQTIDGVTVVANDRVLVKNQSVTAENGVYLAATSAWSRAADANSAAELDGMAIFIRQGTAHQDTAWVQISTLTTFPGDPVTFSQFAAAGGATAGPGILIGGSTISVRNGNGLTFSGQDLTLNVSSAFSLAGVLDLSNIVAAGTYRSVSVNTHGRVTAGTNPTTLAGYSITDAVPLAGGVTMTGALSWSGGTSILASAPGSSTAWVSTAAYGVGQGDNRTHFGYNSAGTYFNYIRGAATEIPGNLLVGGTLTQGGSNVWTQASLTNLNQLTNGPGYITAGTVGTYSPSLTGAGASGTWGINITGSAGSAGSVPWSGVSGKPTAVDWSSVGSIANVVGMLSWKNYGNSHVIFDASAGTAPNGSAVNNSVPVNAWAATYPTLMGWNGVNTYGVKVNRADYADSAASIGGVSASVSPVGNTLVQRDGNGYLFANYLNSTDNSQSASVSAVMVKAGDNYLRSGTAAAVATFISGQTFNTAGNAATATLATKASTLAQGGGNGAGMTFNWSGQGGQPSWLWGGNDGVNHYVYNPSNFSVNYATTAGNVSSISSAVGSSYTWSAIQAFTSSNNTAVAASSGTLQPTAANTSVGATMSFHRPGLYGLNMGLDSDNVFRIGGWSAAGSRFTLDMAGNVNIPGQMTAAQYSGSVSGTYGAITVGGSSGGYSGIVLTNVLSGYPVIGMFDQSGNGGTYDNTGAWHTYWHRTNACLAIGGSTTVAGYKLNVNGSARFDGSMVATGESYSTGLRVNSSSPTITMQDSDNLSAFLHVNSNLIYFLRGNGTNSTTWDGGPNGRHPMTMDMTSGDVTFSGNVTAYSDRRLKKDITPITGALEKIQQMQGVSYSRIETGGREIGVVAQDVLSVLPEVVKEDRDGYLSVAYGNMVALLIEAVKELKAEVETLKAAANKTSGS